MDRVLTFFVCIVFTVSVLCLFGYAGYKVKTAVAGKIEAALDCRAR